MAPDALQIGTGHRHPPYISALDARRWSDLVRARYVAGELALERRRRSLRGAS
jgi:hypothetical protein